MGGRKKGSLNKTTTQLKEAILEAARLAGNDIKDDGGLVQYLLTQASDNPAHFMILLGKVLPMTVNGDSDSPVELVIRMGGEKSEI